MKLRKVALDVNIPQRLVAMLNSGFKEQGYEFIWEPEFAQAAATDEHWAVAFKRFGGEIVISGDKNIAKRPHQIMAFKENGLICFFCQRTWSNQDMIFKCSHLLMWWMRLQPYLATAKPGDCWWIPMGLRAHPLAEVKIPDGAGKTERRQRAISKVR